MQKKLLVISAMCLILSLAVSCGTSRKATNLREVGGVISQPITDSAQIAASRARAAEVAAEAKTSREGVASASTTRSEISAEPEMTLVDSIIAYAKTFIGTPYQWAANGPSTFDCSGYVKYVYKHFGYDLPRTSTSMSHHLPRIENYSDLRPGDLVFFGQRNNIRTVGHVGMIISIDEEHGSFWFIHASANNGVEIQKYNNPYYMMRYIGAGRVLED